MHFVWVLGTLLAPRRFFLDPPPYTPIPVNRRLHCADLCTVFCSNDAVRALKSHPKVASTQEGEGYRSAMANTRQ
jgi:hypothetical protein